ncbi:ORF7 [Turkey adenovirus 3]|uniref:ORF7 n=1 Tax=Turkey adenovirus 3 TaxID=41678 RepID=Q9YUQ3_9ADEN|nr:hypothetical protein TaV3gp23 [Turkey adenovirus 3]AP_000496.1 ORF7 [Turkey siadenovirus A]AAX51190.1 ORF7 [Avirulent turkey hemorrhagic enteritis virus]AAC64545.1 ORF7 [Turkey adenovirus 3]QNN94731.1 ORF7 [Turkey adenovirus 3]QNN94754.1 ORF7 [Turkey adenovirus 3]QNN94792.1 ORF7 [Turkey adenovirus 3]
MPLTWWLQADIHFNEDDQFQQNLSLTLQAMAENKEEKDCKFNVTIHKEIEPELNTIFDTQMDTWLSCGFTKMTVFSTGKGDIFLRILFRTCATTFFTAGVEGRKLKSKIEQSMYETFGSCLSMDFIKVASVAVQGYDLPAINCNVGKPLVLLVATQDEPNFREIPGPYIKDVWMRHCYTPPELTPDEDDDLCTPLASHFSYDFDPSIVPDIALLDLFE